MAPVESTIRTAAFPVKTRLKTSRLVGFSVRLPSTSSWLRSCDATLTTSSWKSSFTRSVASCPTTSAKITRIRRVSPAETPASRQRTGQRLIEKGNRLLVVSVMLGSGADHVAGAALGLQQAGLVALLELAPQVGDEHVDRVRHRQRVIPPDLLQQALARDHEALVAHQVLEQLELAVGELDLPVAAGDLPRVAGQAQVAHDERRAAPRGTAPQQRAHARQELLALERLREVVVGARVESLDPVVQVGAGGQDQDRHVRLRPQAPADLDAVEAGKPEVEDHEVGHELLGRAERVDAVDRRADLVAFLAQGAAQDV